MTSPDVPASFGSDFPERLVEAFFRRWVLYLLPVVLLAAVGVRSASGLEGEFQSSATLSASANPYVYEPDIRGTQIEYYESAASGTARLINEQLQTDAFIDDIVERVGLGDAVDSGIVTRDDIRSAVYATDSGRSNINIPAFWGDPNTAVMLVEATISGYREYLGDLAASDSSEAIEFWSKQQQEALADIDLAQAELTRYVEQLPLLEPGEERPTEQVLEIQRLNSAIDRGFEAEREAQAAIDQAEFAASQALSNTSRELLLIDPPVAATTPTSVRRDQIVSVAMFTMLGLVMSAAALLLGTAADKSIRTRLQLISVCGTPAAVVIPRLRQPRRWNRKPVTRSEQAA